MENTTDKTLRVYMLNEFSIMYGDENLNLEKFGNSKLMELFQILLRYKKNGISREQILQMLYEDDSVDDKNHSIDSLVYRLKRTLKQTGVDQEEFFHIKNGVYKWNEEIPVELDVIEFETMVSEAENAGEAVQRKCLFRAFYSYELEFLEGRTIRPWILEERLRLKKLYSKCIQELAKILEKEQNYQALYEIYSKAAELYPYDEWQSGQILALQHMKRYSDAYKLYHHTVKQYFDELGYRPSQKQLDNIQSMARSITNPSESILQIQTRLKEEGSLSGAYYCTYPGFLDIYRYTCRLIERSGQSIFLMVCGVYYLKPSGQKSPRAGDILQDTIGRVLRKGDSFTRYSENQFLILLNGTKKEDCERIFTRIRKNFKKANRNSNCELEYYTSSILETVETDGHISFKNGKTVWMRQTPQN